MAIYKEWLMQNGKGNSNAKMDCLKSKIVEKFISVVQQCFKSEIRQCMSELDFINH